MAKRATRPTSAKQPRVTITDLIDKATLQALQDRFSEKHRVPSAILDENANPITFERRHSNYCKDIRKTKAGYRLCRNSDRCIVRRVKQRGKPSSHTCNHGRLRDFAAPLYAGKKVMAYFFIGQMKGPSKPPRDGGISKRLLKALEESQKTTAGVATMEKRLRVLYEAIPVRSPEETKQLMLAATEFAEDLSSALSKVMEWRQPGKLYEFVSKLARAGDLNALYDTCVREIPKLMGTRNCSVLTVVYGKPGGTPKLVLQRTRYRPRKKDEGTAYYTWGQGLTGWVWKNKRPLRLANLKDAAELAQYKGLEWAQVVNDSPHHREWLGVPLIGSRQNDVLGVIRVPEKLRAKTKGGGGFSFEDEILLTTIGQHVARRIEELRASERVRTAMHASQECAVALCQVRDEDGVSEELVRTCEKIFGHAGKAYFVNLLAEEGECLQARRTGGSLALKGLRTTDYPLVGSLSGFCLRKRRPVIVHDVPKAAQQARYVHAVRGLKCGMSAPIISQEKRFGVISVGSDRQFEFREEPDLHILRDLASLAGAAFARLEAEKRALESLLESVRGVTHTLGNRIPTLKSWVSLLERKAKGQFRREISGLNEGVNFISEAVSVATRFHGMSTCMVMQTVDVRTVLGRLERLYADNRISWDSQGRLCIVGDRSLIEQAVVELLANALRFISGAQGKVSVSAYPRQMRRLGHMVRDMVVIQVDDNGPGVPADRKEKIFQAFHTGDPAAHFGVGLSFVYSVVQRHGGLVEECGRRGHGASFRMAFPCARKR